MLTAEDGAPLQCCVTVEQLGSFGQAARRKVLRKASVILGRNEFQELVLRVQDGKAAHSFLLKDFTLFTKFAGDGKCTVKLLPENTQLLMSNCPPDTLRLFLNTLSIKHQAGRSHRPVSSREKLRAGLPRSFQTVSPLQQKDIRRVNELRSRAEPSTKLPAAGSGQQVKRSRGECNFSPVSPTPRNGGLLAEYLRK